MESLSYRTGNDARRGGLDITISLTPEEVAAIGSDASALADWFDTTLWALAMLRSDTNTRGKEAGRRMTAADLSYVITDLDSRLLPRLQGILTSAIRQQARLGGTLGDLARAMDAPKSTAQSRRATTTSHPANTWELWASQGGPAMERCVACGKPAVGGDPIVTTDDDDAPYRIHRSHTEDKRSGFRGVPYIQD